MAHARVIALFGIVVAVAGCGGGSTTDRDAASVGNDSGTPGVDAASPDEDAASDVDAATVPMDDAAVVADDTGSTASGACTNTADTDRLAMPGLSDIIDMCARPTGAEPRTRDCIRSMSGLTQGCADCFDATVRCTIMNCALMCAAGDTPGCTTCRMNHCDGPFATCSGIAP